MQQDASKTNLAGAERRFWLPSSQALIHGTVLSALELWRPAGTEQQKQPVSFQQQRWRQMYGGPPRLLSSLPSHPAFVLTFIQADDSSIPDPPAGGSAEASDLSSFFSFLEHFRPADLHVCCFVFPWEIAKNCKFGIFNIPSI